MSNRSLLCSILFVSVSIALGCSKDESSSDPDANATDLGGVPVCEASALVEVPWDEDRLLVGDNEEHNFLFTFLIDGSALTDQRSFMLPSGPTPRDIESLAWWQDTLWVIGSHARNDMCQVDPRTRRIRVVEGMSANEVRLLDNAAGDWELNVGACLSARFVSPAPEGAMETCQRIVDAAATGSMTRCDTFNIEGAAATGEGADARLWIGLRSPLAERDALLLRVAEPETFTFDRVVRMALDGSGIRELYVEGDTLWGIAGPTSKKTDAPHRLFRVPAGELDTKTRLTPEIVIDELPIQAEGLVVRDGQAWLVSDGARGQEASCNKPSKQARVSID